MLFLLPQKLSYRTGKIFRQTVKNICLKVKKYPGASRDALRRALAARRYENNKKYGLRQTMTQPMAMVTMKNLLIAGTYLFSSRVQMLTRFQSGSENILPTPCPSAEMRSAPILYFSTRMVFTASARALAILALISALPSGEA